MNKMNKFFFAKLSQSLSDVLRSKKDNTLISNDLRGLVETCETSEVACAYAQAKFST
jgi:hypothetical protein